MIHERFCCNRGFAAATSLSAGGLAARSVDILFKDAFLSHDSARPSRCATSHFRDEPSQIMRASRLFRMAARRRSRVIQSLNVPQGYASALHSLRPCWTAFLNSLQGASSDCHLVHRPFPGGSEQCVNTLLVCRVRQGSNVKRIS